MNTPTFRTCQKTDMPVLIRLVEQLYLSDPGDAPATPDINLTFAEFGAHPEKGRIVLFEMDGEVVGYAILVFFWSNEFRGDVIEVDELLVDEKHRGKGISRAFFAWLDLSYQDCAGFSLQVSQENEAARRLYASIGFEPATSLYLVNIRSRTRDKVTSSGTGAD